MRLFVVGPLSPSLLFMELGVFLMGPRAVFAFYSHAQPLFRNKFAGAVPFASDSKPSFMLQREFQSRVNARAFVNIASTGIPRWPW